MFERISNERIPEYPRETALIEYGDKQQSSHASKAGIEPGSLGREARVSTNAQTGQQSTQLLVILLACALNPDHNGKERANRTHPNMKTSEMMPVRTRAPIPATYHDSVTLIGVLATGCEVYDDIADDDEDMVIALLTVRKTHRRAAAVRKWLNTIKGSNPTGRAEDRCRARRPQIKA
ncbi:hypothetical protein DPMN_082461 [Dreissena polymorpha]|uniref:Uncharacterized protein n=1 Tax=Dreissena polymorpha TaxID=45954 RepID=A0A9D3YB04_DREPO|nr:hypothetical protein DPMN_082461 [Dreissena polymorpha]